MSDPLQQPRHRGEAALQSLVEYAPGTGGLALWAQHRDCAGAEADPSAAKAYEHPPAPVYTDGFVVHYRVAFASLPLALQMGWVAHEVLHIALRHPQRFQALQQTLGDVDLQLFNVCADAIVNSSLAPASWLRLPTRAVMLTELLDGALGIRTTDEAALRAWDVERLYRLLDDREAPARPGSGGERPVAVRARVDGPRAARARALGGALAEDLRPRQHGESTLEREAEFMRTWRERLQRAHASDGELSILRGLFAELKPPRVPWEQVLRTRLMRGLALRPALSWSRPARSWLANQGRAGAHRRMPWEPGYGSGRRAPRLAVLVDVSGSIEDRLLSRFATEIEAIARRLDADLWLVIGDDQVHEIRRVRAGQACRLRARTVIGGGGTDFTPLLEAADRQRPDIAVVLTDLQGPARFRPRWPVIWAIPEAAAGPPPPFGQVLLLP